MAIKSDYVKDGFEGWYYPVEGAESCVIILVGSKGDDVAEKRFAAWFNARGCCALGLGAWQNSAQRDGIHEWPLEYFGQAIGWLKQRGVTRFGLFGISMGGNMALVAASTYADFSLTIALEASDYVMEGFEQGKKEGMSEWCTGTSTYTYQGRPLPYVSYNLSEHEYNDLIVQSSKERHEISSMKLYSADLQIPEECFIPIERIRGRLLIIAVQDDAMWQSAWYAKRMRERLAARPHDAKADIVIYPYGTHLLIPYSAGKLGPIDAGGLLARILFQSGRKNAAACRESRRQLDTLLRKELERWQGK